MSRLISGIFIRMVRLWKVKHFSINWLHSRCRLLKITLLRTVDSVLQLYPVKRSLIGDKNTFSFLINNPKVVLNFLS